MNGTAGKAVDPLVSARYFGDGGELLADSWQKADRPVGRRRSQLTTGSSCHWWLVNGGEKVGHCGGGIVYHRHDEKELNWEPGGVRSGSGARRSGLSQESSGSSETWWAALCRLWRRR